MGTNMAAKSIYTAYPFLQLIQQFQGDTEQPQEKEAS